MSRVVQAVIDGDAVYVPGRRSMPLALFDEQGNEIDLVPDPDTLRWKGVYGSGITYKRGDIVTNGGFSWVALDDTVGLTPTDVAGTLLGTLRNVDYFDVDKVRDLRSYTIDATDDTNDIATRKSQIVMLDKTGSGNVAVTFVNQHPTATLTLPCYLFSGATYMPEYSRTVPANGGSVVITVSGADDVGWVAYFTGSDAGTFTAAASPLSGANAPASNVVKWAKLAKLT